MLTRKNISIIFGLIIVVIFFTGVVRLFLLRFEEGDVYPPYSTLRSDPLGNRIFYESLKNFNDLSVTRNYLPLSRLKDMEDTVFLYLGADAVWFDNPDKSLLKEFENLATNGNRVIISFKSETSTPWLLRDNETGENPTDENPTDYEDDTDNDQEDCEDKELTLLEQWDIEIVFNDDNKLPGTAILSDSAIKKDELRITGADYPPAIPWHTILYFENNNDTWDVIYEYNDVPVMIEKKFGIGKIILLADSYLFSNESLWRQRYPAFLSRVIGNKNRVIGDRNRAIGDKNRVIGDNYNIIFDESHFGVIKNQGIIDLMIKYRLQSVLFCFLFIALLYVWKNSFSLIPAGSYEAASGRIKNGPVQSKKDYTEGMTNLLRRNISYNDILTTCYKEWKKTTPAIKLKAKSFDNKKASRIRDLINEIKKNKTGLVSGYNAISEIISEGKKYESKD